MNLIEYIIEIIKLILFKLITGDLTRNLEEFYCWISEFSVIENCLWCISVIKYSLSGFIEEFKRIFIDCEY